MTDTDLVRVLEALLFVSPEPLSLVRLCELTEVAPGPVQRALDAPADPVASELRPQKSNDA